MKKFLKLLCTTIGVVIFIACIAGEVDGIGRFAMVVFGTLFSYLCYFIKG